MWKGIVAAGLALALAGSTLVYAQHRPRDGMQRWQPNAEDMRAFGEARLAALKAGLTLTPEQEKNWPAFEAAAREFGKVRLDQMNALRNAPPANDPAERLRRRATAMADTGAALKKLADATDPLYKSLDDNQKRRFAMLARLGGPRMGMGGMMDGHRHMFRGRDGRDDDGMRHFGPRRTGGEFDGLGQRGEERL
jgi:hypothetical protein